MNRRLRQNRSYGMNVAEALSFEYCYSDNGRDWYPAKYLSKIGNSVHTIWWCNPITGIWHCIRKNFTQVRAHVRLAVPNRFTA